MIATKTKPVSHLSKKNKDELVLTNETSGKQNVYKVHGVDVDEQNYPMLPLRLHLAVPNPLEGGKSETAVIGYDWNDNVEVKA